MKNYSDREVLIFDLDGTLVDSSRDIAWSANKTLLDLGLSERSEEEIRSHIGMGVLTLLKDLTGRDDKDFLKRATEVFISYYLDHLTVHTEPYPGVEETLEALKTGGYTLAIATNKPIEPTIEILKELDLFTLFDCIVGGDMVENKKPEPDSLLMVLNELDMRSDKSLFVGDSAVDVEAGEAADIDVVGVSYGFRGRIELEDAGCESIIDHFSGLNRMILEI
ncbi:MAG: HAD-IA family hydrolase [Deltaproteobacteria bacterium]|nr:HAD-IA family hydrolase [Deltaproteobacteria bacterium]